MQRLLREPPTMELGTASHESPTVDADTPDREVFEQFASYDMFDDRRYSPTADRLLGAVSVDDVVDRMLGSGWRQRARRRRDHSTVTK